MFLDESVFEQDNPMSPASSKYTSFSPSLSTGRSQLGAPLQLTSIDDDSDDGDDKPRLTGAGVSPASGRARMLAQQRELQLKKRQTSLNGAGMVRSSVESTGSTRGNDNQFTPAIRQFSAPKTVKESSTTAADEAKSEFNDENRKSSKASIPKASTDRNIKKGSGSGTSPRRSDNRSASPKPSRKGKEKDKEKDKEKGKDKKTGSRKDRDRGKDRKKDEDEEEEEEEDEDEDRSSSRRRQTKYRSESEDDDNNSKSSESNTDSRGDDSERERKSRREKREKEKERERERKKRLDDDDDDDDDDDEEEDDDDDDSYRRRKKRDALDKGSKGKGKDKDTSDRKRDRDKLRDKDKDEQKKSSSKSKSKESKAKKDKGSRGRGRQGEDSQDSSGSRDSDDNGNNKPKSWVSGSNVDNRDRETRKKRTKDKDKGKDRDVEKSRNRDGESQSPLRREPKLLAPDTTNIHKFLRSPMPKECGVVQCYIRRNKSGTNKLYPIYSLYLKEGDIFLMASKKRPKNKTSNYLISSDINDLNRSGPNYIGKLRSNFVGTEFQVFDDGVNPKDMEAGEVASGGAVRCELGSIMYAANVLGSRGPRKMQVSIPSIDDEGEIMRWRDSSALVSAAPLSAANDDILTRMKDRNFKDLFYLINKPPRWNEQVGAYVLNFNGRVTMASVKNFQLVDPDEQNAVVLQFGRVAKDEFTMDLQYPMSPFQAFAITLSSFDSKIACD